MRIKLELVPIIAKMAYKRSYCKKHSYLMQNIKAIYKCNSVLACKVADLIMGEITNYEENQRLGKIN
jgi:hypothetical protein